MTISSSSPANTAANSSRPVGQWQRYRQANRHTLFVSFGTVRQADTAATGRHQPLASIRTGRPHGIVRRVTPWWQNEPGHDNREDNTRQPLYTVTAIWLFVGIGHGYQPLAEWVGNVTEATPYLLFPRLTRSHAYLSSRISSPYANTASRISQSFCHRRCLTVSGIPASVAYHTAVAVTVIRR